MLQAAIRDPNPVVFLENEMLYGVSLPVSQEVMSDDFVLPVGKAKIEREGSDGRRKGRAVEDSQMLLGRQRNGCDIGLLEGDARRHDLARTERLVTREDTDGWIADKRASDVRQRREICER